MCEYAMRASVCVCDYTLVSGEVEVRKSSSLLISHDQWSLWGGPWSLQKRPSSPLETEPTCMHDSTYN